MPADSEVTLPHTWRPLGTRLAGWFFFGLLILVSAMAWLSLGDLRGRFSTGSTIIMLMIYAAMAVCVHALTRCRLDASTGGLKVVNGYRARTFTWPETVAITMPEGAPWATLDLADGTAVSVIGIQATDGDRAVRAVRQVRALIDTPPGPQPG